ncbi:ATP-binding cassette domain-containing protein [Corynebacterium cystitidis]|uniref:ATP-binding cassette domain-containing protein n=1 Tax=Corynebacterium cystitidis TaxID=35757 RepID=UPI00211E8684|nr:ATP-binding cassette domain-containing protein [Corynebacterium cystitidis]
MSLHAHDISFAYPGAGAAGAAGATGAGPILCGIDLEVPPGVVVGLHGYSGAGKSTLAKILAGQLLPDAGQVTVDGQPLHHGTYLPVQLIQQHPERAIDARWRLNKVVRGISAETLERMGVEPDWLERYPLEVSGGQLQRINISRALDPRTKYVVADEITTMMDALLQADIWAGLIDEVQRRQLGLLVISHDHDLLRHVCDRVVALDELGQ